MTSIMAEFSAICLSRFNVYLLIYSVGSVISILSESVLTGSAQPESIYGWNRVYPYISPCSVHHLSHNVEYIDLARLKAKLSLSDLYSNQK